MKTRDYAILAAVLWFLFFRTPKGASSVTITNPESGATIQDDSQTYDWPPNTVLF